MGDPFNSVGDAIWWSITTVTTVGYGDMFPVTPAGRGVATVLMLTGIASVGSHSARSKRCRSVPTGTVVRGWVITGTRSWG